MCLLGDGTLSEQQSTPKKCRLPQRSSLLSSSPLGPMESAFSANLIFCLPLSVPHLISLCALGSISQHGCSRIRTSAFGLTLGLGIIRFCNPPDSAPMSNVRLCFLFGSSLLELGSPKYGLYNIHSTLTSHPEAWACKQVAV